MDSTVHIAFCSDLRYTKPLAVAVRSVIDSARDPRRLMFWLTAQEGREPAIQKIVEMARGAGARCELLTISAADPLLKRAPSRGHISIAAYYRLYVPELLPAHVERIIYLDSDIVVRHPIEDLWSTELKGSVIAAVMKPRASEFRAVGLRSATDYFNSGVLLIDTALWRSKRVRERALGFALSHPDCTHGHDQPALNHVFAGNWIRLDARWNQQFKFFVHTAGYLGMSRTDLRRLRTEPYVVHYTTQAKPWQTLNQHPWRSLYYEVLDRTPFAGWRPERAPLRDRVVYLVSLPLPHYLRPGVLRNVFRPHFKRLLETLHLTSPRRVHA